MGRASSIEKLPADILDQLQALLRDPRVTQMDATRRINAVLSEIGEEVVSSSAVNRYAIKMEEVGSRLRQSREMAEMWIAKLGAQPSGQVGHLINEILRTLSFDLSMKLGDGELTEENMPAIVEMMKNLSLTVMRLEKASSENVKREQQIREQARREAAEAAEKIVQQSGLSDEAGLEIRRAILGVKS